MIDDPPSPSARLPPLLLQARVRQVPRRDADEHAEFADHEGPPCEVKDAHDDERVQDVVWGDAGEQRTTV